MGLESTVIFLSEDQPVLLRAGGIPLEEIVAIIGPVRMAAPVEDRPEAPGQLKHHYAPRKPFRLVHDVVEIPSRPGSGWLAFGPQDVAMPFGGVVENLSPTGDLHEAA